MPEPVQDAPQTFVFADPCGLRDGFARKLIFHAALERSPMLTLRPKRHEEAYVSTEPASVRRCWPCYTTCCHSRRCIGDASVTRQPNSVTLPPKRHSRPSMRHASITQAAQERYAAEKVTAS